MHEDDVCGLIVFRSSCFTEVLTRIVGTICLEDIFMLPKIVADYTEEASGFPQKIKMDECYELRWQIAN